MAEKISKQEAGYVDEAKTELCQDCSMYRYYTCTLVKGRIEPKGHCNEWESGVADE